LTVQLIRRAATAAVCLATAAATCTALAAPALADTGGTNIVINEVYGGGGNSGATYTNDFIELYNPTDAAIDVSTWIDQYASSSGTSWNNITDLSGSIPAGGYYLIQEAKGSGGTTPLPTPDATGGISMSGTHGKVALVSGTGELGCGANCDAASGVVDFVGFGSDASDFEGSGPAPTTSNSTSDSRTNGADTNNNAADFTAGAPSPQNSGGSTPPPPTCTGTMSIAEIQGTDTDTSPCAGDTVTTTGVVTAVYPTGGFNGFYLQTGGTGGSADATPGASDAVFVYGSYGTHQVTVGESVEVTGDVSEYNGTTEIGGYLTITDLGGTLPDVKPGEIPWDEMDTDAEKEAHEGELLAPQGDFTVSSNYDVNYFGTFMLAAGTTPLMQPTDVAPAGSQAAKDVAAENLRRAIVLDDGASASYYPDGDNSSSPLPWLTVGTPARVGSQVTFHQPVVLRYEHRAWSFEPTAQVAGDGSAVATFAGNSRADNEQPAQTGGDLRLATFNVENYFAITGEEYVAEGLGTCTYYRDRYGIPIGDNRCTGFDGSSGPRGAATAASLARQQAKIVTGINRLGASIVSLEEVANSVKFGRDRDYALSTLVDALNAAAGSDVWAYVPSPDASELPPLDQQDVIRVAMIYRPADVTPVGRSYVLADDSGPGQAFSIAREPLAQAFRSTGTPRYPFLVVANHFKSKGADADGLFDDCVNGGDAENTDPAYDQGGFNCTRVHQARDMVAFAQRVADEVDTSRIFLLGDFNAYTHEDPMQVLYDAGFTDLGSTFDPSEQTYNYNDLAGSLDHVLANADALRMVTGADVWQINAQESVAYAYSRYNYNVSQLFNGDEPFAASDHDPVVVGLDLLPADRSHGKPTG
jgi:predicted extracellular nuclease